MPQLTEAAKARAESEQQQPAVEEESAAGAAAEWDAARAASTSIDERRAELEAQGNAAAKDATDPALFYVDGERVAMSSFSLAELTDLEDYMGAPTPAIAFEGFKAQGFVIYLVRRRHNPKLTLAEVLNITVEGMQAIVKSPEEVAAEGKPTDPPGSTETGG